MRNAAALLLVSAALAACTALSPIEGRQATEPTAPAAGSADVADGIGIYLQTLRSLIEGDPVEQADVFRNVAAAADTSPTTTNKLMLALALATPTHPSSDEAKAQALLNELLAAGDTLLPEERTLALMNLKDVEARLILEAEANRLQRAAAAATAERNDRTTQQLQAALEENRQLKLALDDVRARLDAITNIERSIRERENGPNTP
ncbi:MAG TPA: hypothetical protein VNA66_02215 [Gammaproteobacteria bacterium]|nr:hypothetical protein [Gammaproteobacteria bacterium]